MFFEELDVIRKAAKKAADRSGTAFYVLCNPSRKEKRYTAVTSAGFGLPAGFYIEEKITPDNERVEIEPPEKISTNGF